jgi:hypothetical protein
MQRYAILFVLVCTLLSICCSTQRVFARTDSRIIRLTILVDYAHPQTDSDGKVTFDGTISSQNRILGAGGSHPDLPLSGLRPDPKSPQIVRGTMWYLHGFIKKARVTFPDAAENRYHLHFGPLTLLPDDQLILIVPFVNLDYLHIVPPPDNLEDLVTQAEKPADQTTPKLFELSYRAAKVKDREFDIPFTTIRKKINIELTPLVGEMIMNRTDSFRLSGQVTFDNIRDFGEYNWDCLNDPALQKYRYNTMHLLFALDSPPGFFSAGMLSSIYQSKPTYVFIRTDTIDCKYDRTEGSQVTLNFNGQVYSQSDPNFPSSWQDTIECNARLCNNLQARSNEYILEMGDVALAPGDELTITIPNAEIRQINPLPTRLNSPRGHITQLVFEGPFYSKISFLYEPEATLILSQMHTSVRTGVREIEQMLGPFCIKQLEEKLGTFCGRNIETHPPDSHLTWRLGILAILIFASKKLNRNNKIELGIKTLGWALVLLVLFYGMHYSYGLLAVAILIYLNSALCLQPLSDYLPRVGFSLIFIITAMLFDRFTATKLFAVLRSPEVQTTPMTPLILFCVGIGLVTMLLYHFPQISQLFPHVILASILILVPLALFDAMQQSLLSLIVLGIGIAYILLRLKNENAQMSSEEVIHRLKSAWCNRLVPVGFILLILFAAQNGLQSTSAVLGPLPIFLSVLLPPVLLFISILTSFLAIGLLFLILYPLLPSNVGYLKALIFGLFLLLIFYLGIAADEELASTWQTLMVGRFVYYTCVPLLLGLLLDTSLNAKNQVTSGSQEEVQPNKKVSTKDMVEWLRTLSSLAIIVVPSLYAYFTQDKLVMNYFDLLQMLLKLGSK